MPSACGFGDPEPELEPANSRAARAWLPSWRAALVAAVLAALLGGWAAFGPRCLHGSPLPARPAPGFGGLRSAHGTPFDWQQQRGRAVLVFFGYTHCPDVCPLTLAALGASLRDIGALATRVRVVFVTLDPQRDSAPLLRRYLAAFVPDGIGLRGSPAATARAARAWGVHWRRVVAHGQIWIDHSAAVTLVDPNGLLRARYGYAQLGDPALLARDLRRVLHAPLPAPSSARLSASPTPAPATPGRPGRGWPRAALLAWAAAAVLALLLHARGVPNGARRALFAGGCALCLAAAWGLRDPLASMTLYALALMSIGQLAPALLLLGWPPAARSAWRRRRAAPWLLDPSIAALAFVSMTLGLNLPGVFDHALADSLFSAPVGLLALIAGLSVWAQLLRGSSAFARGWQAGLYGWAVSLPMMLVAAVWVWSDHVLYTPYLDVLCLWNLGPLADQHSAGLVMFATGLPLQLRCAWLLIMPDSGIASA